MRNSATSRSCAGKCAHSGDSLSVRMRAAWRLPAAAARRALAASQLASRLALSRTVPNTACSSQRRHESWAPSTASRSAAVCPRLV